MRHGMPFFRMIQGVSNCRPNLPYRPGPNEVSIGFRSHDISGTTGGRRDHRNPARERFKKHNSKALVLGRHGEEISVLELTLQKIRRGFAPEKHAI